MRILITGATGLIGRSLTPFLLSQGHQITALTRSLQRANNLLGQQVTTGPLWMIKRISTVLMP